MNLSKIPGSQNNSIFSFIKNGEVITMSIVSRTGSFQTKFIGCQNGTNLVQILGTEKRLK